MGDIKRILLTADVPAPPLNTRFIIELCENVHIHYRNLRIEMTKGEFLLLVAAVRVFSKDIVEDFDYRPGNYRAIANTILPEKTPFDTRFQVEEQRDGTIHIHYRNIRLEA